MAADWALIVLVIIVVIGVYFAIGQIITACLDLWRNRDESH